MDDAEPRTVVSQDPRGTLVALEHGDVPFTVRRTFVVVSGPVRAHRGGHRAGGRQYLMLVNGGADIALTAMSGEVRELRLSEAGRGVLIGPDDWVDYWLDPPDTVVLVLAEEPFRSR